MLKKLLKRLSLFFVPIMFISSCDLSALGMETSDDVTIDDDIPDMITVTWMNCGKPAPVQKTNFYIGDSIVYPTGKGKAPTASKLGKDYVFAGWVKERAKGDIGEPEKDLIATENITLHAVYKFRPFKVSWYNCGKLLYFVEAHNGDVVTFDSTKVKSNIQKAEDDKFVYTFAGWSSKEPDEDDYGTPEDNSFTVLSDLNIYAVYSHVAKEVSVEWISCGSKIHSTTAEYKSTISYDGSVTPSKPAGVKGPYIFIGWSHIRKPDDVSTDDEALTSIFVNDAPICQIHAVFKLKGNCNITFKNDNGSTITTKNVKPNEIINLEQPKKTGVDSYGFIGSDYYTFVGWNEDPNATTGEKIITAREDTTYFAIYNKKTCGGDSYPLATLLSDGTFKYDNSDKGIGVFPAVELNPGTKYITNDTYEVEVPPDASHSESWYRTEYLLRTRKIKKLVIGPYNGATGVKLLTNGLHNLHGTNPVTNIELLEGMTTIGHRCFFQVINLEELIIPNTITKLGQYALGYYTSYMIKDSSGNNETVNPKYTLKYNGTYAQFINLLKSNSYSKESLVVIKKLVCDDKTLQDSGSTSWCTNISY